MTEQEEKLTERAKEVLKDLLIKSFLPSDEIEIDEMKENEEKTIYRLNIVSDEPQTIIGRHGEAMFALQQILRVILKRELDADVSRVIVDVDNYRKGQERSAVQVAKIAIQKLLKTGEKQRLYPMPSYKRRAIHTFLLK